MSTTIPHGLAGDLTPGIVRSAPIYRTTAAFAIINPGEQLLGTVVECPVLGADGVTAVGTARWVCVQSGAGPATYAWRLVGPCSLAGTDENRPSCADLANGASFVGTTYRNTSYNPTLYRVVSSATWVVQSANDCADRCAWGPSAINYAFGGATPTAAPIGGPGTTFGLVFQAPTGAPVAADYLAAHADAGLTRGWALQTGFGGVPWTRFHLRLAGPGALALPNADYAAGLGAVHAVAIACDAGNPVPCRYSYDGGGPWALNFGAGVYVPPNAADNLSLLNFVNYGGTASIRIVAWKSFSTAATDADLLTLTSAAVIASGRIPTPAGQTAEVPYFRASAWPEGAMRRRFDAAYEMYIIQNILGGALALGLQKVQL